MRGLSSLLILLLASPAVAQTVTLEPETGFVAFKKGYKSFPTSKQPPDHVTASPPGKLTWLSFPWGRRTAVIALGERQVWPDRDGDGDLAEERPVPRKNLTTVVLDLQLEKRKLQAKLEINEVWGRELRLTNLTRMSGTVRVGDRDVKVSLTDYLVNGRYDDVYTTKTKEYWLCDHIHFDLDGDGAFKRRIPPQGEDYSLARGFVLEGALYGCVVEGLGERLKFSRRDAQLVTVPVNVPSFMIALLSDEYGSVRLRGKKGSVQLPPGLYQLRAYDYDAGPMGRAEVSGLWWKEDGVRTVRIAKGSSLTLKGPLSYPLRAWRKKDGSLAFTTTAFGPNGARVMVLPRPNDNLKPELRVEDPTGKVLYKVTSNYC